MPATNTKQHPLIGRAFHTQDENLITYWQGEIIADCGDGYFLAQLFSWMMGEASTAHVMHISELAAKHDNGNPKFRFFDNLKDANSYMDNIASHRDRRAAALRREDAT